MPDRGTKHEDPRNISTETPPRHHSDGALCITAVLHADCPLNHSYARVPMTANEKRWWYVELMLEELAALEPDCGAGVAGSTYEVDEVVRAEDGLIATVFGTVFRPLGVDPDHHTPYILGDV
jgi:hypothetical protein